jgi:cyclopropane fatty-acyl-phospholipid synthase-like methyltransferase
MKESPKINSKEYWDFRFSSSDWENNHGKEQTSYFSEILLNNLPKNILEETNSMLDWGCALGQLSHLWKQKNKNCDVFGYDLSEEGVKKAISFYPDICFDSTKPSGKFDTVVCSNVLEHLSNWQEVITELKSYANKYVIILVPYNSGIGGEHIVNFTENMFDPEGIIEKRIIDCYDPVFWPGQQLLIIYEIFILSRKGI